MSKVLEVPKEARSPHCFYLESTPYPLEQFRPHPSLMVLPEVLAGNEQKLIQCLIDKSDHRLRMYGSADELLENVEIFKTFPGAYHFFKTHDEPYQTPPTIYYSVKNEKFISKCELFGLLQHMVIRFGYSQKLPMAMVAYYLKHQEELRFSNSVDFVRFDEKILDEIEAEIHRELRQTADHYNVCFQRLFRIADELKELTFDRIVEKFATLAPLSPSRRNLIRAAMEQVLEGYGVEEGLKNAAYNFAICETTIATLRSVMEKRPEMFLPTKTTLTTPIKTLITVRLFEDGDRKFVMKEELFKILDKELHEDVMNTMTFQEVLDTFGDQIEHFQFVRYPILRAKHRAVPIPIGFENQFCILEIDAFFEMMRSFILGLKMFQFGKEWKKEFSAVFKQLAEQFVPDNKNPHFVPLSLLENYSFVFKIKPFGDPASAKDVRNAKKNIGFSVQNLKNELEHLGLTTTFSEIQDHAESVYSDVDNKKKGPILTTGDLFAAVEHCQLLCILDRVPRFKTFLHNQKGCSRVYGHKCEICHVEKSAKIENLEKELAQLQLEHRKLVEEAQRKSEQVQEKIQQCEELKKTI